MGVVGGSCYGANRICSLASQKQESCKSRLPASYRCHVQNMQLRHTTGSNPSGYWHFYIEVTIPTFENDHCRENRSTGSISVTVVGSGTRGHVCPYVRIHGCTTGWMEGGMDGCMYGYTTTRYNTIHHVAWDFGLFGDLQWIPQNATPALRHYR